MSEPPSHAADPYAALRRVLALRPAEQRKLLRLVIRCETGKCTPLRVFGLRDGWLVQCRSDADVRDMQKTYPHLSDWSRRRAFFLEWWMQEDNPSESRLQVVCDCDQTRPRLVDVQRVLAALPAEGEPTRNASLPEFAAPSR